MMFFDAGRRGTFSRDVQPPEPLPGTEETQEHVGSFPAGSTYITRSDLNGFHVFRLLPMQPGQLASKLPTNEAEAREYLAAINERNRASAPKPVGHGPAGLTEPATKEDAPNYPVRTGDTAYSRAYRTGRRA
jgi:hypothetical protein